jgi:rSAM/selenodomain-associated transferase 1
MKEEALIIFVRKPELGKVKTRLAAVIGAGAALEIYQKLLEHTHAITSPLTCDKFVFYAEAVENNDIWQTDYRKQVQATTDLGGRMAAAFNDLFGKGYKRVCIIGSDCFDLTTDILQQAFFRLTNHDIVIGPASDGGYYLLGMSERPRAVFDNVEWSTKRVMAQTKMNMAKHGYSFSFLPELTDVDTVDDLPEGWLIRYSHNNAQ